MILYWRNKTFHIHPDEDGYTGVDSEKQCRIYLRRRASRPQVFEVIGNSQWARAMANFYFFLNDGIFEAY